MDQNRALALCRAAGTFFPAVPKTRQEIDEFARPAISPELRSRPQIVLITVMAGEWTVDNVNDPPGLRCHHRNAMTEVQRFVDTVGDKQIVL